MAPVRGYGLAEHVTGWPRATCLGQCLHLVGLEYLSRQTRLLVRWFPLSERHRSGTDASTSPQARVAGADGLTLIAKG
jgi:hypothetical protein